MDEDLPAIAVDPTRRRLLYGGAAMAGTALLAACGSGNGGAIITPPTPTPTPTPTPSAPVGTVEERDQLNLALNALYVEGQFLSFAVTGQGLPAAILTGTGASGQATGARRVTFADSRLAERFTEILANTIAHIALLRELLSSYAVAQPTIDLSAAAGPFGAIAAGAGFTSPLDPYADETSLLLGSFYLIDVSVTYFKQLTLGRGSSARGTPEVAAAAVSTLSTKSAHAGMIRLGVYRKGLLSPDVLNQANAISDFRDLRDGADSLDQGITSSGSLNLTPTGSFGGIFARTPGQLLRLLYLQAPSNLTISRGGFLPNGANGVLVET